MKRYSLIAVFDKQTNKQISKLSKTGYCKVPCTVENRFAMDTLPPHLTLAIIEQDHAYTIDLTKIEFPKNFDITSIDMKESKKGGYGIYLISTYGHVTLAVFENQEKAQTEFKKLKAQFKPFTATISAIQIYEIYPARLLREFIKLF